MIQCRDCEYFSRGPDGTVHLLCEPFVNIKELECLAKHQLVELKRLAAAYQATAEMYRRLAPLQEKMFRHMEQELDEAEEADSWKHGYEEEDEEEDQDDEDLPGPSFTR